MTEQNEQFEKAKRAKHIFGLVDEREKKATAIIGWVNDVLETAILATSDLTPDTQNMPEGMTTLAWEGSRSLDAGANGGLAYLGLRAKFLDKSYAKEPMHTALIEVHTGGTASVSIVQAKEGSSETIFAESFDFDAHTHEKAGAKIVAMLYQSDPFGLPLDYTRTSLRLYPPSAS